MLAELVVSTTLTPFISEQLKANWGVIRSAKMCARLFYRCFGLRSDVHMLNEFMRHVNDICFHLRARMFIALIHSDNLTRMCRHNRIVY